MEPKTHAEIDGPASAQDGGDASIDGAAIAAPGAFIQSAPHLENTYEADDPLREHLARILPADVLAELEPELSEMGRIAAGEMLELARGAEAKPPSLVRYDAWGNRIDRIETPPEWRALHEIQAKAGLAGLPHGNRFGEYARVVQAALLHLYGPSSAIYNCPISMTDGAARTLQLHGQPELRDRIVPRLVSDDPANAWTSGQWMTERPGGSDVGRSETVARRGVDGRWRLHGVKWFTSATTADCALALARPEGAAAGSRGLALFCVELVDPETGESQVGRTILVNRLKDKLGTRALPTAELTLDGALATPVGDPEDGVQKVAEMLSVCRLHNTIAAAAMMRRGQQLAESYAREREAFGTRIDELPLHRETLDQMNARAEAVFAMAIETALLFGRVERGVASDEEANVLRALVPLAKLFSAKEAVWHASETLECFGGAGYVEDTGLPALLRDAQVLPIWEGTTNVLSLDLLRAEEKDGAVTALLRACDERLTIRGDSNSPAGDVDCVVEDLGREIALWSHEDPAIVASGMRGFARRLGHVFAASVLIDNNKHQRDVRGVTRTREPMVRAVSLVR